MLKRKLLALLVMLLLVASCGAFQKVKELRFDEMSSEQKAVWMNDIYSSQYDDYKVMAIMPNLTESQKKMMRVKKKIFTEVWPLLKLYSKYVATGVIPAAELEAKIMKLLNRLISEGGI